MKIVCIKPFRDKTTAKKIEDQKLIKVNDVITCDDELAKERIRKGFAKAIVEEVVKEVVEEIVEETEEVVEEVKPKKKSKK